MTTPRIVSAASVPATAIRRPEDRKRSHDASASLARILPGLNQQREGEPPVDSAFQSAL